MYIYICVCVCVCVNTYSRAHCYPGATVHYPTQLIVSHTNHALLYPLTRRRGSPSSYPTYTQIPCLAHIPALLRPLTQTYIFFSGPT